MTGAIFIISRGKKKGDASHEGSAAPTEAIVFDAADEMVSDASLNYFLTTFINGAYADIESDVSADAAEQDDAKQQNENQAKQEANARDGSANEEEQKTAEENEAKKEAEQNEANQASDQIASAAEYDANDPAGGLNILETVVSDPRFEYLTNGVYPISYSELDFTAVADWVPTEWNLDSDDSSYKARYFSTSEVNLYCEKLFNLSQESIDAMYDQAFKNHSIWKNSTGEIYYVLIPINDTASSCSVAVTSVKTYDSLYYVYYDVTSANGQPGSYYAVMKKDAVEGSDYWTMYRNTANIPESDEPYTINNK